MKNNNQNSIDEYILNYPEEIREKLIKMREVIRKAAPEAEETIKYGIPTYVLEGNLVHFGGAKQHIGFYPGPAAIIAHKKEFTLYKQSKGAVQFPLDKPIPASLVSKVVKYRVKENLLKAKSKVK